MAVPANLEPKRERTGLDLVRPEWQPIAARAARLYGQGYDRKEISKAVAEAMYEDKEWPREEKVQAARTTLRRWEEKAWFRDLVWDSAVIELDMSTGQILRGIKNKAKRGRVDAAKLALAVTGRYNEKEQAVPASVTINLVGVPRPARQAVEASSDVVLGEVVDED
jgi:hypothetical protein